MSLLTRLAALAHLTPDEIQHKISPSKWIRFGDLTDEDFERLADKHMVLVKAHYQTKNPVMDVPFSQHWKFWGHTDRSYFHRALKNFWGILAEDYRDGDLPDPEIVRARALES